MSNELCVLSLVVGFVVILIQKTRTTQRSRSIGVSDCLNIWNSDLSGIPSLLSVLNYNIFRYLVFRN